MSELWDLSTWEPQPAALTATDILILDTVKVLAAGLPDAELRVSLADIFRLEDAIIGKAEAIDKGGIDAMTRHHFAPGVYCREITIPRGVMLTGAIHKSKHLAIVSAGDISVLDVHGVRRVKAPAIFLSEPGIKRVGLAHEHTVFTCVHANPDDERDLQVLWDRLYHNQRPEGVELCQQ